MADLDRIEGLFVGQLSADELRLFNRAARDGRVRRSYEGTAGIMGLAKVRRIASPHPTSDPVPALTEEQMRGDES